MKPDKNHGIFTIILNTIREYKMFNFMVSILILLILSSLLEGVKYNYIILNSLSTFVFIAGVYAASKSKRSIIIMIILGIPWFLSEWIYLTSDRTVFLGFFFFLYITYILFENIFTAKDVTPDTLYGAACCYLLLGLLWSSIYGVIDHLSPGTIFNTVQNGDYMTPNEIMYFSYTTLTTLGYGDITLLSPEGRIVSVLEAIIGQLFLTFVVARLIAMYSAKLHLRS